MARSAKTLLALATLSSTLPLAACDTTFNQNARAKLAAERTLASREPQLVKVRTSDVRVRSLELLDEPKSTAVVAELENVSDRTLTDVPITVGARRGDDKDVLNGGKDLSWFQTHVPVIAAGERSTWVFRSPPGRHAQRGQEPFVRVGAPDGPSSGTAAVVPPVTARVDAAAPAPRPPFVEDVYDPKAPPASGHVRVELTNPDEGGVPQRALPVYVVIRRGQRLVGAGAGTLDRLEPGRTASLDIPVTGDAVHERASAYAYPSMFQ